MSEFGTFMARYRREGAETVLAEYIGPVDGSASESWVRLRDTRQQVRATRANGAVAFAAGQVVLVGRPESSGRSKNTGYTLLGPAPGSATNSSASPPIGDSSAVSSAIVTRINPRPVRLRAGGVAQAVAISGAGFTVAPTYGSADIMNAVAPVVTPSLISLQLRATETAGGVYDVTIGGEVYSRLIEVARAGARLWIGAMSQGRAWKVNPETFSLIATVDATAHVTNSVVLVGGVDKVYLFSDGKVLAVDKVSGALAVLATGLGSPTYLADGCYAFGAIWISDGSVVRKIDPVSGATLWTSGAGLGRGVIADDNYVWASSGSIDRIDPVALSTTHIVLASGTPVRFADDGTYLYYTTYDAGPVAGVYKFNKATLNLVGSVTGYDQMIGIAYLDGYVYASEHTSFSTGRLIKIATSTMTEVARSANGTGTGGVVTDGSSIWSTGFGDLVYGIRPSDMATITTVALPPASNIVELIFS